LWGKAYDDEIADKTADKTAKNLRRDFSRPDPHQGEASLVYTVGGNSTAQAWGRARSTAANTVRLFFSFFLLLACIWEGKVL
jgi:hypothetical protein